MPLLTHLKERGCFEDIKDVRPSFYDIEHRNGAGLIRAAIASCMEVEITPRDWSQEEVRSLKVARNVVPDYFDSVAVLAGKTPTELLASLPQYVQNHEAMIAVNQHVKHTEAAEQTGLQKLSKGSKRVRE